MAAGHKDLQVGTTHHEVLVRNLTRSQIVQYAGAVGDFAPEHTDEVYATQAAHLPSVFAHAMFTTGMTARMLTNWVGVGRLVKFGVRFTPTRAWPGDTLTATATVEAIAVDTGLVDLRVVTTNDTGGVLLAGYAVVRAPGE